MGDSRRVLSLNLYDTRIGIWQDDANDPSFRHDVFGGLIRHLRSAGWSVGPDRDVVKRYAILAPDHRRARKGPLHAELSLSGRCIEVRVWSTDWLSVNSNGHRHCFDILQRMPFLTRLRVRLCVDRIERWLGERFAVSISRKDGWEKPALTPLDRIAADYAKSPHSDKSLGRPACTQERNARSADGSRVEHDTVVWYADDRGRICRGRAYYNINNMWWVVAGGRLLNEHSGALYVRPPSQLRRRRNERRRREALERRLSDAIRSMRFERAGLLRTILFGAEPVFQIWSTKNGAYYGPNFCGYTSDGIGAGRYTRDEAFAEVRRVPHILQAVSSDGARLSADQLADAAHG